MINSSEILKTLNMFNQQHLDIRTITMGISLLDCADPDPKAACQKVYDKICKKAEHLVATGQTIEKEFGIPIVNKRVSVTPISLVASASNTENYAPFAAALDKAAKTVGINFIGGFSALVQKGFTQADRKLINSIPEALATTDLVCSSVNVGSTKAGINMDAVAEMGRVIKKTADLTAASGGFGCAKLVIFANAVEDNPFMAGAFHGVGEPECVINVGISGPGVVHHALQQDAVLLRGCRVIIPGRHQHREPILPRRRFRLPHFLSQLGFQKAPQSGYVHSRRLLRRQLGLQPQLFHLSGHIQILQIQILQDKMGGGAPLRRCQSLLLPAEFRLDKGLDIRRVVGIFRDLLIQRPAL